MNTDEAKTLATITRHRDFVREAIGVLVDKLEHRALVHDESKLREDEFDGFARINRIARENPYGSEEYKASMEREKATIDLHYSRNSHHPEHHDDPRNMGFLDIVEMVCDWWAASKAYGNAAFDAEFFARQFNRWDFSKEQCWLIREVAAALGALEEE